MSTRKLAPAEREAARFTRYTHSLDGVPRVNVHVIVRLDEEQVARLSRLAIANGSGLNKFLADCLWDGVANAVQAEADDGQSS